MENLEFDNLNAVTEEDFVIEEKRQEEKERQLLEDMKSTNDGEENNSVIDNTAPTINDFKEPVSTIKESRSNFSIFTIFVIICLCFTVGYLAGELQKEKDKIQTIKDNMILQQSEVVDADIETIVVAANSVEDIVDDTMPALVSINTTYEVTEFSIFFGYQTYKGEGAGSGFIIKMDNNEIAILTNAHVVNESQTITVTFNDGQTKSAVLKSIDNKSDLALVSVNTNEVEMETLSAIKCVKLGDSNKLKLGQSVIAIGNCLGYGQTVTTGVVSAVNRTITDDIGNTHSLIQTDAAINAGNSGGVLLDMAGRVIGINEAKIADIGVDGVGFAIPITDALKTVDMLSIVEPHFPVEESKRGKLGITCIAVDENSSQMYGIPEGVMIREVAEGECAANAGLRENDVILKIDDKDTKTVNDVTTVLKYKAIGDEITVVYSRNTTGKWEQSTVKVTLTAWIDQPAD